VTDHVSKHESALDCKSYLSVLKTSRLCLEMYNNLYRDSKESVNAFSITFGKMKICAQVPN